MKRTSNRYYVFVVILAVLMLAGLNIRSAESKSFRVVFLGDARTDYCEPGRTCYPEGFNRQGLTATLVQIANLSTKPNAVFFTGDMVLGLKYEGWTLEKDEVKSKCKNPNEYKHNWPLPNTPTTGCGNDEKWVGSRGFTYDSDYFEYELEQINNLLDDMLPGIPLFPIIGNHEAHGINSIRIFRDRFLSEERMAKFNSHESIKMSWPTKAEVLQETPDGDQLMNYQVEVGPAKFLILTTDYFSEKKCVKEAKASNGVMEHRLSDNQLEWLKNVAKKSKDNKFFFVLGHEPVKTVQPCDKEGKCVYDGLDAIQRYPSSKNKAPYSQFVIQAMSQQKNAVYVNAHQHLFDAGWQTTSKHTVGHITTGGSGAPFEKDIRPPKSFAKNWFRHFVIADYDSDGKKPPKFSLFDVEKKQIHCTFNFKNPKKEGSCLNLLQKS